MGMIDDYYGGYENLSLFTDYETGEVDFESAYNFANFDEGFDDEDYRDSYFGEDLEDLDDEAAWDRECGRRQRDMDRIHRVLSAPGDVEGDSFAGGHIDLRGKTAEQVEEILAGLGICVVHTPEHERRDIGSPSARRRKRRRHRGQHSRAAAGGTAVAGGTAARGAPAGAAGGISAGGQGAVQQQALQQQAVSHQKVSLQAVQQQQAVPQQAPQQQQVQAVLQQLVQQVSLQQQAVPRHAALQDAVQPSGGRCQAGGRRGSTQSVGSSCMLAYAPAVGGLARYHSSR